MPAPRLLNVGEDTMTQTRTGRQTASKNTPVAGRWGERKRFLVDWLLGLDSTFLWV